MCTTRSRCIAFFFFNDTATTEIYTLSLHDALPISVGIGSRPCFLDLRPEVQGLHGPSQLRPEARPKDRKSTRLNSSHSQISYAVFCLKKKKFLTTHLYMERRDWSSTASRC